MEIKVSDTAGSRVFSFSGETVGMKDDVAAAREQDNTLEISKVIMDKMWIKGFAVTFTVNRM